MKKQAEIKIIEVMMCETRKSKLPTETKNLKSRVSRNSQNMIRNLQSGSFDTVMIKIGIYKMMSAIKELKSFMWDV